MVSRGFFFVGGDWCPQADRRDQKKISARRFVRNFGVAPFGTRGSRVAGERGFDGGWGAHPRTLGEIPETRLAAPVAAVVGVEPGAASPAQLGKIGVPLQHASAAVARSFRSLAPRDILLADLLRLGAFVPRPKPHVVS